MADLREETLRKHVDRRMQAWIKAWNVPGAALGIVNRKRVIHLAAYGLRDVRQKSPVTINTLFSIASCTKAMTAVTLGILVDEGKLSWDQSVRDILPDFKLRDPVATALATPRDLLTHRLGLPSHDLFKEGSSLTRRQLLSRLRHLESTSSFRTTFQYNNLMYIVAGVIVERLSGMPWEEFLRRRVLDPLGMTSTRFLNGYLNGHDPTPLGEQLAIGYQRQGERLVRWLSLFEGRPSLEEAYGRPCGPNGSVVSCVGDLCQWLRLQLNGGMAPDGNQIISKESLAEIHTPQVVVPQWSNSPWPELLDACYGFGWGIQPYRGRNWIFHDGNNCGFNAHISLLPADGLGVVLLTNVSQSPLVRMVPFEVFDRLLDVPDVGWNRRFKQSARQIKARQALAAGKVGNGCAAVANLPSTDLSAYAGRYHNPGYGTMHLRAKQGRLEAVYNRFVIRFRCAGKDFFKSVGTAGGGGMKAKTARFRRNRVGRITGVAIPMTEDAQELEIVFNKKDREA